MAGGSGNESSEARRHAPDASGNTNGNVILQIDRLSGGYAAMDNFFITASDNPGDVPGTAVVPLPPAIALMLGGALLLGGVARRSRRI